jgi:hypothetical protein
MLLSIMDWSKLKVHDTIEKKQRDKGKRGQEEERQRMEEEKLDKVWKAGSKVPSDVLDLFKR